YRGRWVLAELRLLLPASLVGIGIGTWLFGAMSPAVIRLLLGIVAVVFTLQHWLQALGSNAPQGRLPPSAGVIAAATAGFTSFVAHAGGPPISMYLLRRHLDRTAFVGTTVVFFAVVNYVKLIPYTWLDQLDDSNLSTSLVLAPLAPVGVAMGVWLHNRVTDRLFFRVAYTLLFVVGLKLMYDGAVELNAS
ncbi:MAG TPA: sulfite exporter TauE/SafE family protein, partial [Woeseiaceae bacterium]